MNKFVRNTLFGFVSNAFIFILSFVFTPLIIRKLGQEAFGVWTFVLIFSINGLLSYLDFGFQGATEKKIAEYEARNDWDSINATISNTLLFFSLVGVIVTVATLAMMPFLFRWFNIPQVYHRQVIALLWVFGLGNLIFFPSLTFGAVLGGLQKYDQVSKATALNRLVFNVGAIVLLLLGSNIVRLGWYFCISYLLIPIWYVLYLLKHFPLIRISLRHAGKKSFLELARTSSGLFIARMVGLVYGYVGKVLIGIFLNMAAMALFEVINRLYSLAGFFSGFLRTAALGYSTELITKNRSQDLRQFFLTATKIDAILTLSACAYFCVFGEQFVRIWTLGAIRDVSVYLWLSLSSYIFIVWMGYVPSILVAKNRLVGLLWISISSTVLNVVISALLIKPLGIAGLFIGTSVGYLVNLVLYIVTFLGIIGLPVRKYFANMVRPVISVAILVLLLLAAKLIWLPGNFWSLFLQLALVVVVYAPILWFVGLDRKEHVFFTAQLGMFMKGRIA